MSTRLFSMVAAAGVAVTMMMAGSEVHASDPVTDPEHTISGAGRAVVTNEEGFLSPGVVTTFALNAVADDDSGAAMGHFTCMIPGGDGGLTADITGGVYMGGGCMMLTGFSTCVFPGLDVFFDEPITLFVCEGGPGAGGFILCFDNAPSFGCDEETVLRGRINYQEVLVP